MAGSRVYDHSGRFVDNDYGTIFVNDINGQWLSFRFCRNSGWEFDSDNIIGMNRSASSD